MGVSFERTGAVEARPKGKGVGFLPEPAGARPLPGVGFTPRTDASRATFIGGFFASTIGSSGAFRLPFLRSAIWALVSGPWAPAVIGSGALFSWPRRTILQPSRCAAFGIWIFCWKGGLEGFLSFERSQREARRTTCEPNSHRQSPALV